MNVYKMMEPCPHALMKLPIASGPLKPSFVVMSIININAVILAA